jgi:hypothetical protein
MFQNYFILIFSSDELADSTESTTNQIKSILENHLATPSLKTHLDFPPSSTVSLLYIIISPNGFLTSLLSPLHCRPLLRYHS